MKRLEWARVKALREHIGKDVGINIAKIKNDNMEKSKKPTPEEYGWVDGRFLDEEDGAWITVSGEEKHYKALSQWNDEKINELFDENGMCKNHKKLYFDKNGDLMDRLLISNNYMKYLADSDIVKMYYAQVYSGETIEYWAYNLFFGAF